MTARSWSRKQCVWQFEDDTTVEAFSVLASLTEIEALLKDTWEPNIRFDLQISPAIPVVTCSRVGLQSAIMNLLFNARDAMPKGGVISLVAALIYEGQVATDVELRVTDNGFGMTKDTLLRATDPFFTTKTTGLGGLGLPMVMSFVHGAGGRLYIESEHGVGTTVTLRLPISESEAQHQPASPQLPKANSASSCHYLFGIWPGHPSISIIPAMNSDMLPGYGPLVEG